MKRVALFMFGFLSVLMNHSIKAQDVPVEPLKRSGWFFSPRVGYDIIPMYENNTPNIDYKGGIEAGISVDYYWNWFGVGTDFDFIKNQPRNTFNGEDVFYIGAPDPTKPSFSLTEQSINRTFIGIGPSFKYSKDKMMAELNLRGGYGTIKGGRVEYEETTTPVLLNFHAGYNYSGWAAKAQLRFTYFIKEYIGLQFGGYFINHFKVQELVDPTLGISSGYWTTATTNIGHEDIIVLENANVREKPCDCNISSIGVFAGVVYQIPIIPKIKEEKKVDDCNICDTYALAVTARDKFTGEILPDTDIAVKDLEGNVVQTGTTNKFGVVVFNDIKPDNYLIEGLLYEIPLESSSTKKDEFKPKETLQKQVLYDDPKFILKGKIVTCNTEKPLSDASVYLKNEATAEKKITRTDETGEFIFHLKQKSDFELYGKKENYLSQIEHISTKNYDRNATLFVKLEICMEEADCGNAITLKNIHYDLDKYFIREDAKPELDRLVQFMKDNPFIKVEISSHTDSRASKEYNRVLSENRAKAAVDYLVSQGIERSRLIPIGYGESRLLNQCADGVPCSEEEHQINRRTEMKVICLEDK